MIVVVVASGPSLTDAQCAYVEQARQAGRCRVVVVNDNWRKLPDAELLYATDGPWWELYADEVRAGFRGECWTHTPRLDRNGGRNVVEHARLATLAKYPWINAADLNFLGGNSGAQAIELALQRFRPERVALIGFDMQRTDGRAHWFGDHPKPLTQGVPTSWIRRFDELALAWKARSVSIVNCTISTALACFPRAELADVL